MGDHLAETTACPDAPCVGHDERSREARIAATRETIFADLQRIADFAEATYSCDKTVRRFVREGTPHVRINGRIYIDVPKARVWLLERGAPSSREPRGRGRPALRAIGKK